MRMPLTMGSLSLHVLRPHAFSFLIPTFPQAPMSPTLAICRQSVIYNYRWRQGHLPMSFLSFFPPFVSLTPFSKYITVCYN
ncbi:hypothetical protein FKM82_021612 [Ascaphus truei]